MGHALGFGIGRLQINFLRIQHVVLRPGDASQHNARGKLLFVDPQPPYRCFHKLLLIALVVNGEIFSQARSQRLNVTPQQPHAKRMKGRDQGLQQRASAHQLFHALGHLAGGFVGECDRQDGIRRDAHILDHVGDAVSDSARFSTAGPGQHQHRVFNGLSGLALLGIELV